VEDRAPEDSSRTKCCTFSYFCPRWPSPLTFDFDTRTRARLLQYARDRQVSPSYFHSEVIVLINKQTDKLTNKLDSMRWFSHRRRNGGHHNCITYLLTGVVAWPTATPASPTSVWWFFCVVTPQTATFWGVGTQGVGPMAPKFELGRDLCTVHLIAKLHHPTFSRSEIIVLTNKQTNKQTWRVTCSTPPPSLKTLRLSVLELWVLASPIGYHWQCVSGHCACAVSRDLCTQGKFSPHIWNPWPRFAYSLYKF